MDCNNVNRKKRTALANALFCIEALDIRIKRNKPEENLDEILLALRQIQEATRQLERPEFRYVGPLDENGLDQIKVYYQNVIPKLRHYVSEQIGAAK